MNAISKAVKAKQIVDTAATSAAVGGEAAKAGAVVASQTTMTTAIVTGQATQATAVTTSSIAQAAALKILGAVAMGANAELGISAAIASAAALPFPGNLIAMGTAFGVSTGLFTAAKGVSAGLATPFAGGAIVSGPTLGLVGEYPGAQNNPEVIAPLDKLKKLIPPNEGAGGTVLIKFANGSLEGYLQHRQNIRRTY
ncbi:MAG: hypothetical protein JKY55_00545 [Aliivibrio sp.]|nr:hypothetical protein [Aliivibrio sp.]